MPAYKDEIQQYHRERIRDILVLKPAASAETIKKTLASSEVPLNLDIAYLRKQIHKIRQERYHRFAKDKVESRLAEIQDATRLVSEQMWKILVDTTADTKARVAAGKVIIDGEHKLLEAQMTGGVFDRKLGTLAIAGNVEHTHRLPAEIAAPIMRALENHGLIKPVGYRIKPEPALTAGDPATGNG